jgi:hypothetical protein
MKLSYIFSLLPLVAANDGYLFEDRRHLRRALTAEGVQGCGHGTKEAACSSANCSSNERCVASCSYTPEGWDPCNDWCPECVPHSDLSNDYEMVEMGDGWEEDVDGDYILEEE